ncbi:DNA-3-methyladenine glycosylase I [Xylocopilactobacillus apicola]|uniref:DNA-3-methyladenine glycosylase I n=1 Tax=Xylocopilactobacillus apicola TaxID=2932184 RepID=A0AAU9D855_9LACO|nr:DNA-3-methyladenine glycosylase I [Xylocopilactobacillus apicola]BDR58571.1 DNA-3-methyladenine glycosylase I [Xylocopilactobacillus apicola]
MSEIKRCFWANDPIEAKYHDEQWGRPEHDDQKIFEMLILEMFQAGLSWRTILVKRNNFRNAYDQFDYHKVANYNQNKIEELMSDPGIVRNRQKVNASINNAQEFLKVQAEFGSFDQYIWHFTNFKTIDHRIDSNNPAPAKDELSIEISNDLKKRGFKFVGPVTIYSLLQSIGIINDHELSCDFHFINF